MKLFDAFAEKADRKSYSEPFVENRGFVSMRITVYFPDDIPKVCDVVRSESDVVHAEDKADALSVVSFGYRSYHLVVKVESIGRDPQTIKNWGA